MRFSIKTNLYGRWGANIELSEYDAIPPIDNIAFDARPLSLNPEVEAAALTLLFGRFSGGEMSFAHKVGPNTAKAIQRFLEPTISFVDPIEYYPKPLPLGEASTVVSESFADIAGESAFISLRTDQYNGAIKNHTSIAVASNSFTLKQTPVDLQPALASAMLFADDLEVGSFLVPQGSIKNFEEVKKLLSAVRINLELIDDSMGLPANRGHVVKPLRA